MVLDSAIHQLGNPFLAGIFPTDRLGRVQMARLVGGALYLSCKPSVLNSRRSWKAGTPLFGLDAPVIGELPNVELEEPGEMNASKTRGGITDNGPSLPPSSGNWCSSVCLTPLTNCLRCDSPSIDGTIYTMLGGFPKL